MSVVPQFVLLLSSARRAAACLSSAEAATAGINIVPRPVVRWATPSRAGARAIDMSKAKKRGSIALTEPAVIAKTAA